MEFGLLQQFGESDPVVYVVEAPRLVCRVSPEAWGLMTTACLS